MRERMMSALRARLAARRDNKNESGLALIDVLIGLTIFALLVTIAITAVNQYRMRAYEAGALSDARQIGVAVESEATDAGRYPDDLDASTLASLGVKMTPGNIVAQYEVHGVETFSVCVEHRDDNGEADAWARYDSAQGGITGKGRNGGCQADGTGDGDGGEGGEDVVEALPCPAYSLTWEQFPNMWDDQRIHARPVLTLTSYDERIGSVRASLTFDSWGSGDVNDYSTTHTGWQAPGDPMPFGASGGSHSGEGDVGDVWPDARLLVTVTSNGDFNAPDSKSCGPYMLGDLTLG